MGRRDLLNLIVAILICELAGIIGSLFTVPAIPTWYASLVKPVFNPPSFIFGPVWTTLYALMGIALFLVWRRRSSTEVSFFKKALFLFFGQLLLNTVWSVIFFGLKDPLLAFIDIAALWLAIIGTTLFFYHISKAAAYLLLPYLLWVTFAAYLNFAIWTLN